MKTDRKELMRIVIEPSKDLWAELVKRPTQDFTKTERIVEPILDKVKRNGDKALKKFIREYDHVDIKDILISQEEILDSSKEVSEELKNAINSAKENIKKFHEAQVTKDIEMETIPGVFCSRKSVPIKKIGFYIPGGTAPLFSTVLMLGVPARIAGCEEIIICTPTNSEGKINPVILYTASLLGIEKIAKVGGAQAIAAMAYGTESIPRVDKIFGPGNQFVTVAKQIVSRDSVAIDMPAGPSEVLVVAGKKSNPAFVAADLLSQAEHGVDSQVVLVSKSKTFIKDVLNEIDKQVKRLSRRDVVLKALANSLAIQIKDKFVIADFINEYAPEHLIVALRKPGIILQHVCNAGSVFTGDYTPEAAGDYASGTNHTLPTNGWARSIGGVSLDSFIKKITYQRISPEGLQALGPVIEKMAEAELLEAHKNAVSIRLKYLKENGPS